MTYTLDWNKLLNFHETEQEYEPKQSIPFSLHTTYLQQEFSLDLVVWHLKPENLEQTKKVVEYILTNFNQLFETAWTALYYWYLDQLDCTLPEFFQMICFDSSSYSIRVEINSDSLASGLALYHFVTATDDDLSEDNLRLYMQNNTCCACDTNNEGMAIVSGANFEDHYTPEIAQAAKRGFEARYARMEQEHIPLAPPFRAES